LLEHDPAAEDSFRNLRSSLLLMDQADAIGRNRRSNGQSRRPISGRRFLFTSAHSGEGKTFCAVNCAISFAQLGFKTLIVDGDVRQSDLAQWFFPETPPTGTILCTDVPNLSAVFADKAHANEQEFLPHLSFEQLMRQAGAKFDRIVVDSAPVNLVNDTFLFAQHVHSVCLVIRAGKTPAEDVMRATQRLAEAGAAPVGFVWNYSKTARPYYYSYYGKTSRGPLPWPIGKWSFN
jgi:succinoglycan biosynthesis transport protein ExoP